MTGFASRSWGGQNSAKSVRMKYLLIFPLIFIVIKFQRFPYERASYALVGLSCPTTEFCIISKSFQTRVGNIESISITLL